MFVGLHGDYGVIDADSGHRLFFFAKHNARAIQLEVGDVFDSLEIVEVDDSADPIMFFTSVDDIVFEPEGDAATELVRQQPIDPTPLGTTLYVLSNSGHVRTGVYHDYSRSNVKHWAYAGQPVVSQARREGACDLVRIEGAIRVGDKDYGINGWVASIDLSTVDP